MTKHLTLSLDPDTHSWLIAKARSLGRFPDEYVEDLIDQARTCDLLGGMEGHPRDGNPRNLEASNWELREPQR